MGDGRTIDDVMAEHKCGFREAVEMLAKERGIELSAGPAPMSAELAYQIEMCKKHGYTKTLRYLLRGGR